MSWSEPLKRALQRYFPNLYARLRALNPSVRRHRRLIANKGIQQVFATIHEQRLWINEESISGGGSTLSYTEPLRRLLPELLQRLNIHTLLDAPCGDFNWMQHVDLGDVQYIGADIVPKLVEELQQKYASPRRSFIVLDLTSQQLPQADALLCRDCLIHLSFSDIRRVLQRFLESRCTYLIVSHYPTLLANYDIVTGEHRQVSLRHAPFNFPAPMTELDDSGDGGMDACQRVMAVWHRDAIPDLKVVFPTTPT